DYTSIDHIGQVIAGKFKSHWAIHDEIIEIISNSEHSRSKVKNLIKAIDKIIPGCVPNDLAPDWAHNTALSTENTTVLTLAIY
ncbi:MAG: hypothetical protein JWQ09_2681, partial [Segetibacter sp.]|nr:hypothetical protein [Segetibacter sp.]